MKGPSLTFILSLFMNPWGSYYHIKLLLNFICCKIISASSPTSLVLQLKGLDLFSILNWVFFLAARKLTSSKLIICLKYSSANILMGRYLLVCKGKVGIHIFLSLCGLCTNTSLPPYCSWPTITPFSSLGCFWVKGYWLAY